MKTPSSKPPINNLKIEDNYISWFEIPALNFHRAVNFYNSIYQIQMETNEMNGYSMAFSLLFRQLAERLFVVRVQSLVTKEPCCI